MTYQDTVNWMFMQLPMYQKQGKSAYKKDLTNTLILAKQLNNPQEKIKTIHIAGTNGKGSTSNILASVLQESGYKVGLYTSPHLKDFRERIKINGKEVSKQFVIGFINRNKTFLEENTLSFFEMTVGMAFDYFAKQKVDIAIIEVGLGGRLDSTNIITPEISVITNIGFDHTQYLGNTLAKIATEKAGIIKPNIPIVVGETQKETQPVFNAIAAKLNSKIYYADQLINKTYASDLKGNYQAKNIKTVLQTIAILQKEGWKITNKNVENGIGQVVKNTGLKGRWQILQHNPKVICDTAHNTEGITYTMSQIQDENFKKLHMVFGVVNDKDLDSMLNLLPKKATYYFCKPNIVRGKNAEALASFFKKHKYEGKAYKSVNEAYIEALNNASPNDLIYIGGSTFVVAEII